MRFLSIHIIGAASFIGMLFFSVPVHAQESLSISITPPLFQLNVTPGETFKSSVKVINTNRYPLTVYATVFDFKPKGEDGQGDFAPRVTEGDMVGKTLADWISLELDTLTVPPEQSTEIPITVSIPNDATPGGHFAAILVGTRPPDKGDVTVVRTSQVVTSLFFLRVAGDVQEEGKIREFSVAHLLRESPEAEFSVRFENVGNVHLQPQGGISIYNMWGKERGFIPINQKSHFGNVLPQSIRKFDFSWRGEGSIADIGRYMAEVTLVYGQDGRTTVNRILYFWVLPIRAALLTLCGIAAFVYFVVWMIRRYIQRTIYLSGYEDVSVPKKPTVVENDAVTLRPSSTKTKVPRTLSMRDYAAPLREGVLDLRRQINSDEVIESTLYARMLLYIRTYKVFFLTIGIVLIFGTLGGLYLVDVLTKNKSYEVTVERGDVSVVMSSEEIIKGQLPHTEATAALTHAQDFTLNILNATAVPGSAATVGQHLETLGYRVHSVTQVIDRADTTEILYDPGLKEAAETLRATFSDTEVLIRENPDNQISTSTITIMVGMDNIKE